MDYNTTDLILDELLRFDKNDLIVIALSFPFYEDTCSKVVHLLQNKSTIKELFFTNNNKNNYFNKPCITNISNALQDRTNLYMFSIYRNNIDDEDCTELSKILLNNSDVYLFNLLGYDGDKIGDGCIPGLVDALTDYETKITIDLDENGFTHNGAVQLAKLMLQNDKVTVDLGNNDPVLEGFPEKYKDASTLQDKFDLDFTKKSLNFDELTSSDVDAIDSTLSIFTFHSLTFSDLSNVDAATLQDLSTKLSNLETEIDYLLLYYLRRADSTQSCTEIGSMITGLNNLYTFQLEESTINSNCITDIANAIDTHENIRQVTISYSNMKDDYCKILLNGIKNNELTILDMSFTEITDVCLDEIISTFEDYTSDSAMRLNLQGNNFTNEGALRLANMSVYNDKIEICDDCIKFPSLIYEFPSEYVKTIEFYIDYGNGADFDSDAWKFSGHSTIKLVIGRVFDELGKAKDLKPEYKDVTTVEFKNTGLGNDEARVISYKFAEGKTKVKELILSNNAIGDEGAEYLAQAIGGVTTFERLDLTDNNIADAGAVALLAALQSNPQIVISLEGNPLNYDFPDGYTTTTTTTTTTTAETKDSGLSNEEVIGIAVGVSLAVAVGIAVVILYKIKDRKLNFAAQSKPLFDFYDTSL